MILILFFALLGLWLRGAGGLLLGGLIGYALHHLARAALRRGLRMVQSRFVESTFAVAGAISKADGVVTRDEIAVAERLFDHLHLDEKRRREAKAAFSRGKAPEFDLDAEVDQFVQVTRGNTVLFQLFLQVQVLAALADGEVHPAEHEMLVRVARRLGVSEAELDRLEALLRAAAAACAGGSGPPPQQRIDDAYAALGVSPDASDDEVKRAYRQLIIENHPDKLAAKGLPESMRELAEERAREINAAYDLIKKSRGN